MLQSYAEVASKWSTGISFRLLGLPCGMGAPYRVAWHECVGRLVKHHLCARPGREAKVALQVGRQVFAWPIAGVLRTYREHRGTHAWSFVIVPSRGSLSATLAFNLHVHTTVAFLACALVCCPRLVFVRLHTSQRCSHNAMLVYMPYLEGERVYDAHKTLATCGTSESVAVSWAAQE